MATAKVVDKRTGQSVEASRLCKYDCFEVGGDVYLARYISSHGVNGRSFTTGEVKHFELNERVTPVEIEIHIVK